MPTKQEIGKAQPLVAELMAPAMSDYKAKKKTAAEVADAAVAYAAEANTEAVKFMLYRSSIPYYVRGEAYDKAAEAVDLLKGSVKNVPADVILEILAKASVDDLKKRAPRLYALYRQAKKQASAEKDVKALRKKPASTANRRKLAEALATAGNWPEALKEFAQLTDIVSRIAKKEQDGGVKNDELGEFWWTYEPTYENADDAFKVHAALYYRKALAAGEITGIRKPIVEQRIKEYAEGVASSSMPATGNSLYCVIDLSNGPNAKNYPVSFLGKMPAGGWTDEYKTEKVVLRKIQSGSFEMGDMVHKDPKFPKLRVELTKPYYIGVFEVTQRQWELVMGNRPSAFRRQDCYMARPVECVSYDDIRGSQNGSQWPQSSDVDDGSFMGKMRARTGLSFDLPTAAQWECACRAGTKSDYNTGKNFSTDGNDKNMNEVGRCVGNGGWNEGAWGPFKWKVTDAARNCDSLNGTAIVGSYLPNRWGLYDMHGNVFELCLDWTGGAVGGKDPVGPKFSAKTARVEYGGAWVWPAKGCTSFWHGCCGPSARNEWRGFRLCMPL